MGRGFPDDVIEIGGNIYKDAEVLPMIYAKGWVPADVTTLSHCEGLFGYLSTNAMIDANNFRELVGSQQRWVQNTWH